jgi:hypothetical protein
MPAAWRTSRGDSVGPAAVYDWFAEGFDTSDLIVARQVPDDAGRD